MGDLKSIMLTFGSPSNDYQKLFIVIYHGYHVHLLFPLYS